MIHYDIPAEQYHSWPQISKSGLDLIHKYPALYKHYQAFPQRQTEELLIGSAFHTLTLEPELFNDQFIVAPPSMDRRTKEGKAAAAELEASGKVVLTASQYEMIQGMAVSVRSNQKALDYITGGKAEVSITAELYGCAVRGRMDYVKDGVIVDLKSTKSASPAAFARSVADYRYHVQAAIYSDLAEANDQFVSEFIFIAVEKTAPYPVGIYKLDFDAIQQGQHEYIIDLGVYQHCKEMDEWPAYPEEVVTLSLPTWARTKDAWSL